MITVQILPDTQTEEEIVPPHFDGDVIQSITLPCFNQEPLWKYSFPEGVSQTDDLEIEFNCEDIFETLFKKNIFTITLERPFVSSSTCDITLKDSSGITNYVFDVKYFCANFQFYSEEELEKLPELIIPQLVIQKVSSEGLITLKWNIEMVKIDLELLNLERQGKTPISVKILPGSEFTVLSNLGIEDYAVTQMESQTMTI